jgi:hypothetical protein
MPDEPNTCPVIPPSDVPAIKKAGRWPTLFYGPILSNLGFGAEYSHPRTKGKEISRNISGTQERCHLLHADPGQ